MGARSGYMIINGSLVALLGLSNGGVKPSLPGCSVAGVHFSPRVVLPASSALVWVLYLVPVSAGAGFMLWVGIQVTSQAFTSDSSATSNYS